MKEPCFVSRQLRLAEYEFEISVAGSGICRFARHSFVDQVLWIDLQCLVLKCT